MRPIIPIADFGSEVPIVGFNGVTQETLMYVSQCKYQRGIF